MKEGTVVFPNQLFEDHPGLAKDRVTFFVEDPAFFQEKFHKQKLVLHRASMKRYAKKVRGSVYIEFRDAKNLFKIIKNAGVQKLIVVDPVDLELEKRIKKEAKLAKIAIDWIESPNFVTTREEFSDFFDTKKRYFQTDFYIWQRKRLDILLVGNKPKGGKWSYDSENRKKLPKNVVPPDEAVFREDLVVKEAKRYVERNFKNHYGEVDSFNYPTSRSQAKRLLTHFLEKCFKGFGPYEDAISSRSDAVFHSKLSAPLNVGLISPHEIVQAAIEFGVSSEVPLASIEGFIRQIIGWREFFRAVYVLEAKGLRKENFFGFKRKLNKKWYEGSLGIPPVDDVIRKLLRLGYCHHIERLMVIGNFMLLCEIEPKQVFDWFMELFIDSYDWVMLPNVYAMSQFSDGGKMVTKPYISGSNYILKMSDYPKGEWCPIWDGLYWRFLDKHKKELSANPRMTMVYSLLKKMDRKKREEHIRVADRFLNNLGK